MANIGASTEDLIRAVDLAIDATADWLHAVLHKIEGDADNSRYWYRRTPHAYEDYADPQAELAAIRANLSG
jgi:hypothetical protein